MQLLRFDFWEVIWIRPLVALQAKNFIMDRILLRHNVNAT